ncbi:MAG: superoxide dismutase [Fe] [Gammaproteobacteria bacterium]
MKHVLPELPYALDGLAPYISQETLEYHYGKHHKTYVDKLNDLIQGTEFADATLEDIIKRAQGGIFNNGAQVWNHTFYWHCMKPNGGGEPTGAIADAINQQFGSFAKFKEQFTQAAVTLFGSGWAWLVKTSNNTLEIVQTSNAGNPLTANQTPLLTCDVWEHAYYVDVRNARPKYLENYWQLINWNFANQNLA